MSGLSALATPVYDTSSSAEADDIEDSLASLVRDDFVNAETYRRFSGVEERLLRALRMRRYQYDPEDVALIGSVDVYIGIAALKMRSAESWINDILLNSLDKPWTIKPEPIPNLPDWLREQVIDALESELESIGAPQNIRERASELKSAALKFATQKAENTASAMEMLIDDQLTTGGWRLAFAPFVTDLCTFPLAVIRDPLVEKTPRLNWDGNKVVEQNEVIYTSRRISPFDFFPSMDSTTTQDGQFIIERLKAQPSFLHSCLGLPGFNDEALRDILNAYGETGFSEMLRPDYQRRTLEDKYEPLEDSNTIDVLIRNGRTIGKLLLENNIAVPDPQAYYESEIWTVNNRTIKAILNPYPLRKRPINATSFIKVPGSLWGEGLGDVLRDVQRIANSAARSLVRNMAFSSGPIGEVDVGRLGQGEVAAELTPYKLYHVESDLSGNGARAFNFQIVPSVARELMEVQDKYSKIADDLSGVPSYVLGNPQVAGAGRTMGGLSMLMANAAKGIKNVILNVDRDVTEPIIEMRYNLNMKYSKNPDVKGDSQVVARGATGLLQRELAQAKMTELLQLYTPYVEAGLIPKEGAQVMIRESMKNTGWPVDEIIPDPRKNAMLQTDAARLGMSMQGLNTGQSTPALPLDGRSQPPPFPQTNMPGPTPQGPVNMPTGIA